MRSNTHGAGVLLLLAAWMCLPCLVAHAEEDAQDAPGRATPTPEAIALLDTQGFAVDSTQTTGVARTYSLAEGPVFVTADAGLACYVELVRRLFQQLSAQLDNEAKPLLETWFEAAREHANSQTAEACQFVVALLMSLYDEAPADLTPELRAHLATELRLLRAGNDRALVPLLGSALNRSFVRAWVEDAADGPARWQVVFYLLTRMQFGGRHAETLQHLQATMPSALALCVTRYARLAGTSRVGAQGETCLFDFRLAGDHRFPGNTVSDAPALPGLVAGADYGNEEAARRAERMGLNNHVRPWESALQPSGLRARLDATLRTMALTPLGAPKLFREPAFQLLELNCALASCTLFDHAVGAAGGPFRVFDGTHHPGFVYPNSAFWTSLSATCTETVVEARRIKLRESLRPSPAVIDQTVASLLAKLQKEESFSHGELRVLERCGIDQLSLPSFRDFGDQRYQTRPERVRAEWREFLREQLESNGRIELARHVGRRGTESRGEPALMRELSDLAHVSASMARIAADQLARRETPDLARRLRAFGSLTLRIGSCSPKDVDVLGVARIQEDGGRTLMQGCAGMDTLWIRYPHDDGHILCRGAVFDYREFVSPSAVSVAAWRRRAKQEDALQRPAWSSEFIAR